jgi:hypothetical protein
MTPARTSRATHWNHLDQQFIQADKLKLCQYVNLRDPPGLHVLVNLDTFHHSEPNGTHLCLVSEPMGPSAASLVEDILPFED